MIEYYTDGFSDEEKVSFIKNKLMDKYEKKGLPSYFLFQYLNGAGNELGTKFWQPHSSSRMAFDLYSWLKTNDDALDFCFEKQLDGMKSGGMGPNMDVFIETKDEVIFIESKFTESADLRYINRKKESESYLSPAYWTEKPYGRKKNEDGSKGYSLEERYYSYGFHQEVSKFCQDFNTLMENNPKWKDGGSWFEPKQETCHLIGILFYVFKHKEELRGKTIKLLNIYWWMNGDNYNPEIKKAFCIKAMNLLEDIIEKFNLDIKFEISAFTIQELLENNSLLSAHIHFPEGLIEAVIKRNETVVGDRTRRSFKKE